MYRIAVLLVLSLSLTCFYSCSTLPDPLRVSDVNPRYFTDDSGKAIYLTGSHTWNSLVDMRTIEGTDSFDFEAYLDFLEEYRHNFIRLWAWDLVDWDTQANDDESPQKLVVSPQPWKRTGPGLAGDGKAKFDLEQFNPEYFERLRKRITLAEKRGIYVSVMLFEGWGISFVSKAYSNHPFHPDNNINGLGLPTDEEDRFSVYELGNARSLAFQEAYVRKVVETIGDFDNILFEISNENHMESTAWQLHVIEFIRLCEIKMDTKHPIGMTFQYPGGSNQTLFESPADWISPNPDGGYKDNPPASDGSKVVVADTDHLWGLGGNRQWVWKSFLRGLNPIYMDTYRQTVLGIAYEARNTDSEAIRRNMGYTKAYADKMDLINMVPKGELSSSGYCLAKEGHEYVAFVEGSSEIVLDLSSASGEYEVEWLNPETGEIFQASTLTGGEAVTLVAPFEGTDAVVYLKGLPSASEN